MSSDNFFGGSYSGARVLVTGHTGFKGSWLTAWLLTLGARVCGYSNNIPTEPSLFNLSKLEYKIRHEIGDITDRKKLAEVVNDFRPDYVFHLAAQAIVSKSYLAPLDTISSNVMGTASLLDTLRLFNKRCVAIIITSDKAYENVEWIWGYRENDRIGGKDIYSGSKGAAELIFKSFQQSFFTLDKCPVRLASARAGNVIGGGDWATDRIVSDCIRSWAAGVPVDIRSARATRPWQHVLEPLSGYLSLGAQLASKESLHGESFNFGPNSEQNATVLSLLSKLATAWGFKDLTEAYRLKNEIKFKEAGLLKLNIDKASNELNWLPTLLFEECVDLTGSWYREVLREGRDANSITQDHISRYSDIAIKKNRHWTLQC